MAQGRKGKTTRATQQKLTKPPGLTPAESLQWDTIVNAQVPGWFVTGSEPLLLAYVRTSCILDVYYQRRDKAAANPDTTPSDLEDWEKLIGPLINRLVRVGAALRLNPHSRQDRSGAKGAPVFPWDDLGGESA